MGMLWGPSKDLDYWTARQRNIISVEERRAMALLASISDERRFSLYCVSGFMPAMGNVTKKIYLIRRHERVLELEDGRPLKSWCIGTPDRNYIPETDHVVTMKTLIEGEELAFRETGNPSPAMGGTPQWADGAWNPYTVPFYGSDQGAMKPGVTDDFADFWDVKKERDRMKVQYESRKRALEEVVREGPPSIEDLVGNPKRNREAQITIGTGLGMVDGGPTHRQFIMTGMGTNVSTIPIGGLFYNNGTDNFTGAGAVQNCVFVGNGIQLGRV